MGGSWYFSGTLATSGGQAEDLGGEEAAKVPIVALDGVEDFSVQGRMEFR